MEKIREVVEFLSSIRLKFCYFYFMLLLRKKIGFLLGLLLILGWRSMSAQYLFEGRVNLDSTWDRVIYLSQVYSYSDLYVIDRDAVIDKAEIDEKGKFRFAGNTLSSQNAIFRLHVSRSPDEIDSYIYSLYEEGPNFILFIANNQDSISFLDSGTERRFGKIESTTNEQAGKWLELEALRLNAYESFSSVSSDANEKRFRKNLTQKLKAFANTSRDAMAAMMSIEHLIQRDREEYRYFLEDFKQDKDFYQSLMDRLQQSYPQSDMLKVYKEELDFAEKLLGKNDKSDSLPIWVWGLIGALILLLLFMAWRLRKLQQELETVISPVIDLSKLSNQEEKIVKLISEGKSNKEIADELSVSHSTIKTHVNNIYAKLRIANRAELKEILKKSTGV
ncbi:MAG: response regulator transcription factor [Bacteroidota bacterium]